MKEKPKRQGIMLAYPLEEGRLSRLGSNFIIQPKINGERCIVEWFAGEPVLISSYGNEFKFMDRIKAAIIELSKLVGDIPLDGEIYKHGWSREQIDSALRRKVNRSSETEELEFHIFDIRSPDKCYTRISTLSSIQYNAVFSIEEENPLKYVKSYLAEPDNWKQFAARFIKNGYEGAILRRLDAPWEPKRTVNMLKFKPTEEDEYIILDINEAIDKHGNRKDMVGSFTVRNKDTEESFKVGAGKLSHAQRVEIWRRRDQFIGRNLVVKHEPLTTSGGVPLCAVAVDCL